MVIALVQLVYLVACPNHLSLPLCSFLCLPTPKQSLNSSEDFLSFSVTLHIHCTISMSFLSSFAKFSSFNAQVSLPWRTTLLTYAWKQLPFVHIENILQVSKENICRNKNYAYEIASSKLYEIASSKLY